MALTAKELSGGGNSRASTPKTEFDESRLNPDGSVIKAPADGLVPSPPSAGSDREPCLEQSETDPGSLSTIQHGHQEEAEKEDRGTLNPRGPRRTLGASLVAALVYADSSFDPLVLERWRSHVVLLDRVGSRP